MTDAEFRNMFKKVAMNRVYEDRVEEWAKAKSEEVVNFSKEKVEKFEFQMALLWQLFRKEDFICDRVIKVCEENDTVSDEYHYLIKHIKKLVGLESTTVASNYLKCIHRYFISKEQEIILKEEEEYADSSEVREKIKKRNID